MLKDALRFTFWLAFLFCLVALFFIGVTKNAFSQEREKIYGLLCYEEQAAEEVAQANQEGGFDLENIVSDALVEQQKCVRIERSDALDGFFIYEGRIIGQKQVVGVSPDPHGSPQLFGLVSISFNGRTA